MCINSANIVVLSIVSTPEFIFSQYHKIKRVHSLYEEILQIEGRLPIIQESEPLLEQNIQMEDIKYFREAQSLFKHSIDHHRTTIDNLRRSLQNDSLSTKQGDPTKELSTRKQIPYSSPKVVIPVIGCLIYFRNVW